MIIYGGVKDQVEKQLQCEHKWHGPCMDDISRYYKCTKCFCLDRDITSTKEMYEQTHDKNCFMPTS